MLTKWAKRILNANGRESSPFPSHGYSGNNKPALIEIKDTAGTTKYVNSGWEESSLSIVRSQIVTKSQASTSGVAIGSGNTPATENDYTLEQQITGITASNYNAHHSYDVANSIYIVDLDYTIENDTGSDITIRELGMFLKIRSASVKGDNATGYDNTISVMLDRTIVDNPIFIANGDAGTLRYRFVYSAE